MTKKTRFGVELACACLMIGCSSGSSRQTPSSYQTTPANAQQSSKASRTPSTVAPSDTSATGAPTAPDTHPMNETKVNQPVTGEPPVTEPTGDTTGNMGKMDMNKTGETRTGETTTPTSAPGTPGATAAPGEAGAGASTGSMHAEATLTTLGENGHPVGTISFDQDGKQVVMKGTFTGLKPGKHGIHIHEKGDCGGKDAKNAGGHFNPTGAKHGPPESGARHAGDFGNLTVDKEGNATFEMTTDSLTVSSGADSIVGKAVIIHSKKDDGKSQPSGNSGTPVACGVIEAK